MSSAPGWSPDRSGPGGGRGPGSAPTRLFWAAATAAAAAASWAVAWAATAAASWPVTWLWREARWPALALAWPRAVAWLAWSARSRSCCWRSEADGPGAGPGRVCSWSTAVVMLPTAMDEYSLAAWACSWLPANSEAVGLPEPAPVVHVGAHAWLRTSATLLDLLLSWSICWPIWAMAWPSAANRGRDHRVLLLVGVHLELLLDQLLGDGGGLGPECGHLIGPGGSRNDDHHEGGRGHESWRGALPRSCVDGAPWRSHPPSVRTGRETRWRANFVGRALDQQAGPVPGGAGALLDGPLALDVGPDLHHLLLVLGDPPPRPVVRGRIPLLSCGVLLGGRGRSAAWS